MCLKGFLLIFRSSVSFEICCGVCAVLLLSLESAFGSHEVCFPLAFVESALDLMRPVSCWMEWIGDRIGGRTSGSDKAFVYVVDRES